jgi:hypothetical protein
MTRTTNARVAGFTYLAYIALAFPSMLLFDRAAGGDSMTARLARVTEHATAMRVAIVLTLVTSFAAIVLGVTLYALTRDEDPELAMTALACRVGEGLLNAVFMLTKVEQLWVGTATATQTLDATTSQALGALLFSGTRAWNLAAGATFFAVGSTLFSWLLLRGRIIPTALAWLGVVASVLLVVGLPLQLAGVLNGTVAQVMWLPMAAFEIPLGFWWLIKGDTTKPRTVRA